MLLPLPSVWCLHMHHPQPLALHFACACPNALALVFVPACHPLPVQVWQPSRGSLPGGAAGQQVLHLKSLTSLKQLQLHGQCELSADLLLQLASHWLCLTALDLCCELPDGTQGFQHFTALRSLRLKPYKWDGECGGGDAGALTHIGCSTCRSVQQQQQ